jgi:tetratricopeptide (TPR) repeat protein
MRIPLERRVTRVLGVSGIALLAMVYVAFAALDFLAAHFSEVPTLTGLHYATRLQPGNAEYQYRLGRYLSLVELSPLQAEPVLRQAVELNPHQARYWMGLAEIYEQTGDAARQGMALKRALEAEPTTPEVAWEAANFYIVRGDNAAALKNLGVVMADDPYLPPTALQLCWRIQPDADFLMREVIPPTASVYSSFLEFLISRHEAVAAGKVWNRLEALNQPIQRRTIFEYIRYLINMKEPDQALAVWKRAATLADLAAYQPSSENLVVNGDFSREILNAGFDWLYLQSPDVSLALDPSQFYNGHDSLRLEVHSGGMRDAGIHQLIPVAPNKSYQFSSYYRAESLAGAGGIHFVIQDSYSGKTYFTSDEFTDADFWKPAAGSFTTDNETRLLVLWIQREPEGKPFKGRLWIDGIRLSPVGEPKDHF